MTPAQERLARARQEASRARRQLMSFADAVEGLFHPTNLAGQLRREVKEMGRELAEDAIQAVKDRPVAASGVAAGIVLFLARGPLWSAISGLWNDREPADESIVTADLETRDENYDLTAPVVKRSKKQGASA